MPPQVGGKSASLGEMYQALTPKGVRVPNGFAVTASAYFYFLDKAGIRQGIRDILTGTCWGKKERKEKRERE